MALTLLYTFFGDSIIVSDQAIPDQAARYELCLGGKGKYTKTAR